MEFPKPDPDAAGTTEPRDDAAFLGLAEGTALAGPDGRILHADAALGRIRGEPTEDLVGRAVATLFGDDATPQAGAARAALAGGRPFSGRLACRRADGTPFECDVAVQPLHEAGGRLCNFVVGVRDLAAQQAIERQLLQSRSQQAMGQFASALAHDFNNLLTVLAGHVGLIEARDETSPEIREALGEMSHALRRATALTRQLLVSTTRHEPQLRVVDLNRVVEQMGGLIRRVVGAAIRVQVRPCPEPLWVRADPNMLDQVLLNLCLNARDAMPDGGAIELIVERIDAGGAGGRSKRVAPGDAVHHARLTVGDTGCGIAPEHRNRVFEPFFTTRRTDGGSGLGLSTVQAIVRQHDGVCGFESEVGRGTRFFVWLPVVAAPSAEAAAAPAAGAVDGGKGERILLVERDAGVATTVRKTLESAGYRVLQMDSGQKALEWCRDEAEVVDLVLTDLLTPDGMAGRELARALAHARPRLPVVLTGPAEPAAQSDPRSTRGAGRTPTILDKPFSRTDLLATVRRAIGSG